MSCFLLEEAVLVEVPGASSVSVTVRTLVGETVWGACVVVEVTLGALVGLVVVAPVPAGGFVVVIVTLAAAPGTAGF